MAVVTGLTLYTVIVDDQVPRTAQLQGSRVELRAAVLDDGTDRRLHEAPRALNVRRGGETWRQGRLAWRLPYHTWLPRRPSLNNTF